MARCTFTMRRFIHVQAELKAEFDAFGEYRVAAYIMVSLGSSLAFQHNTMNEAYAATLDRSLIFQNYL